MVDLPEGFVLDQPAPTAGLPEGFVLDKPTGNKRSYNASEVPGQVLRNAPKSAKEFASNIYEAVRHPLDTAGNLADVAAGGLRAGAKAVLPEGVFNAIDSMDNPETTQRLQQKSGAVGQMLADRYGGWENVKRTAAEDPVGALADASAVLTGGGSAAARLPGMAGRVGEAAAATGQLVDPINAAARAASGATNMAGRTIAGTLGKTTGAGADAVTEAYNAGRGGRSAFLDAQNGNASAQKVVGMANDALNEMYQGRSAAFGEGMNNLGAPTTPMNNMVADTAAVDSAARFKNPSSGFVFDEQAAQATNRVQDKIAEWRNRINNSGNFTPPTAADMHELKRAIGSIRDDYPVGSNAYHTIDGIYKSVSNELGAKVPGYADTMAQYASTSQELSDLARTMSLKGSDTRVDTAARKLLSGLRDGVNTNFGQRRALLDKLDSSGNLVPTLAGMSLAKGTPTGLMSHVATMEGLYGLTHNPAMLAALPAFSPFLVGRGAYGAGAAARIAQNAAGYASPLTRRMPNGQTLYQAGRINSLLGQ